MSEITNADEARATLAQAREEFRELVLGLSGEEWDRKSDNAGWTNGQLCGHIAFTAGGGTLRVSRLRQNKGMNPPGPLMAVLNLVSLWIVRDPIAGGDARNRPDVFRRGLRGHAGGDRYRRRR